ncbi:MAG TPA: SPOR domain-containing protein [Pseudomonadales bacterium]|nr:SPOR domain-containing protein [Pseudomonadales bacterium]
MDNGLKQRVVGAVVLISLAIIFLPMILDGRSNQVPKISYETEIPKAPQVAAGAIDAAPQEENSKKINAQIEKDRQPVNEPAAVEPPAKPAPTKSPATVTTKAVTPAPAKPVATPAQTSLPPVSETNANPATSEVAPAWTIQLASISNADNAKTLRDKLVAKGHRAYIKQSGNVTRVLVGPELKKERAEAELQAIAADKEFGIKGMLIRYQP